MNRALGSSFSADIAHVYQSSKIGFRWKISLKENLGQLVEVFQVQSLIIATKEMITLHRMANKLG